MPKKDFSGPCFPVLGMMDQIRFIQESMAYTLLLFEGKQGPLTSSSIFVTDRGKDRSLREIDCLRFLNKMRSALISSHI